MANTIFRGDAPAVAQVVRITPANPEPGDVFSLTINGKSVSYTAEAATVADVVDGLVAAWNASTIPEFTEITAAAVDSDDDDDSDYLTLTADTAGVPFEVTASTSDAGGFLIVVTTVTAGDPGQNEIQRVTIPSAASGGTFTLTFAGQTSGNIAYNADAATVETALEALSNIAAGDVIVTGASPEWFIEFDQAYANTNVPAITGNGTNLTGAATLTINTDTEGAAGLNEIQSVGPTQFSAVGGDTFRFRFDGASSDAFFAGGSAAELQTKLEGITTIGSGNVLVTRSGSAGAYTYTVEFIADMANENLSTLQVMTSSSGNITDFTVVQNGSSTAINEVQTVRINGSPTGGTFTLTFQGQTTAGIAYNAAASAVKSALEALSNVDTVAVTLSGSTYEIEFQGVNAGTDVEQMTGSAASLTGAAVTIATTQAAVTPTNESQRISFSQQPGGGTFTLSWDPGGGVETTGNIDWDATAAEVETALEGLTTPAPGDFSVSGADGGPWLVEFTGTYAATDVNAMTGSGASLTGGGSQSLTLLTEERSLGPAHFDDPLNWTNGRVPDSGDTLFFAEGNRDCLYGLKQQTTFTAAVSDLITVSGPLHFVDDQIVQVQSSNTLPAGLSAATNYYVIEADRDAGTLKLSASSGGAAVDITDTGTGTHTISVVLTKLEQRNRYTGRIGLPQRASAGYYEYRQSYLAIAATTIELGGGDGSGSGRIKLSTGPFQTNVKIFDTGGGSDVGLPAVLWIGTHASNDVTLLEGELGIAVLATETATLDALVLRSGSVFLGTVTIASIERTGGEILAEAVTLNGSLQIRG